MFSRASTLATTALAAVAIAAAAASPVAAAPRIVNGLNTHGFPTTGALLYSGGAVINSTNASSQCTGTLIGCRTFLTAAHCVVDDSVASHYWVYLQNGGISTVSSITYHPSYDTDLSGRDVAIVKLGADVTGIDPTTINTTHDLDALGIGLDGVIAGFGRTGGGTDYGIKRYGAVVTADCDTTETAGEGNDKLVCWDYDSPGPAGTDSNTCNGDSGGPLFMDFSGETQLVGVTSAGVALNCLPVDHSWDASVYYNAAWIDGQIGADSTSTCGGLAPVGSPDVSTFHQSGALSTLNPDDSLTVELTGTPSLVRFTLNGTDNGSFNPNFFVKEGTGASAADFDCKADGATVFGACEFTAPAAGTWSIFVQRVSGGGEYQVTTTVFGSDPAVCGNNVIEFGEECDGTSDGECDGLCSGCQCPAPICGNSVVEAGEECDAGSDAACPGLCDGGCSCPAACSSGDLYGVSFASSERRFSYKAWLFDNVSNYADLDPRDGAFTLDVADGGNSVNLAVAAADAGWIRADPVRRKYTWKGDGSLDGLRRMTLRYRTADPSPYWILVMRGREVTGAATIDVNNVLDFNLGFDGTCHLESW